MALHQAVALCMDHCQAAELTGDNSWFKTVVLTGGSACLPGLAGKFSYLRISVVSVIRVRNERGNLQMQRIKKKSSYSQQNK